MKIESRGEWTGGWDESGRCRAIESITWAIAISWVLINLASALCTWWRVRDLQRREPHLDDASDLRVWVGSVDGDGEPARAAVAVPTEQHREGRAVDDAP